MDEVARQKDGASMAFSFNAHMSLPLNPNFLIEAQSPENRPHELADPCTLEAQGPEGPSGPLARLQQGPSGPLAGLQQGLLPACQPLMRRSDN
eukprot:350821-Chlamydomonas_euryale.AAC.3